MKLCQVCLRPFDTLDWTCPDCGNKPAKLNGFLAFAPELDGQSDGFNPEFFRLMVEVEPSHFWFVARNRILMDVLRKYFPQPGKVLEMGCGTGFVLSGMRAVFPQASFSGSDIFTEGLAFTAQRVPDAFLFQMDARRIPFQEEFNLIGAFDVLEHIEEDEAVLAQMYRACKPGGGIVLTVPQHRWLWSRVDDFAHHRRRYARVELAGKVVRAGFRVEYTTSFVSLLLPLMLASRGLKKSGADMDEQMEAVGLKVGKLTNAVLGAIMQIERGMINLGLSFPFGGSLLLVARKPENRKE
ncbi:MAG: class I SAM-dependent methyltransferase [Gallionellaceae bacterium]|nr:class I SAM-dependent methyltransferase [Gallionellaceae bacterium]